MCSSSADNDSFAWIGFVLVNLGFFTLIGWGASTAWLVGFLFSFMYSVGLLALAETLYKREGADTVVSSDHQNDQGDTPPPVSEPPEHEYEPSQHAPVSTRVSILYGLAIISMGVTGFFLPINLFPDCQDDSSSNHGQPHWNWDTNLTALPEPVRPWAKRTIDDGFSDSQSFGYVVTTDTTLFSGTLGSLQNRGLFRVQPGTPPQLVAGYVYPRLFTNVSPGSTCFHSPTAVSIQSSTVTCSNGTDFSVAQDTNGGTRVLYGLMGFFPLNNILWIKSRPVTRDETGVLIHSLHPDDSMVLTVHSIKTWVVPSSDHNDSKCHGPTVLRMRAIGTVIASAVPILLASLLIWKAKTIPSTSMTIYIGISIVFLALYVAVEAENLEHQHDRVIPLWWTLSGLLWLGFMSLWLLLSFAVEESSADSANYRLHQLLRWGQCIGGPAFLMGMIWLLLFTNPEDQDTFGEWLVLNILCFFPLIVFGMVTGTAFLTCLGAFGFVLDAGRFAVFVGDKVAENVVVPIVFLVFAISGLAAVVLGQKLREYQPQMEAFAVGWVQNAHHTHVRRHAQEETGPSVDADTESALTSPLLQQTEEEEEEEASPTQPPSEE